MLYIVKSDSNAYVVCARGHRQDIEAERVPFTLGRSIAAKRAADIAASLNNAFAFQLSTNRLQARL